MVDERSSERATRDTPAGQAVSADEVLAGIADVAREHLRWDGTVSRDTPLVEAFALDSLRMLTLVVELEDRFRVRLDDVDESSIQTAGDLADAIVKRKSAPEPRTVSREP